MISFFLAKKFVICHFFLNKKTYTAQVFFIFFHLYILEIIFRREAMRIIRFSVRDFLGMLLLILNSCAHATIQVSPMNISLSSKDEFSGAVSVYSTSTETQYIKVSVKKIIFPGTAQQKEIPVDLGDENGLVVSPQMFILSAQGKHIIRLLPLNAPQRESVYRVYISAVPDEPERKTTDHKAQIAINVIWGVLVYVEPENANILLSYDRNSDTLINHGNRHIRVLEYGFCSSDKNCKWKSLGRSLYPGMSLKIPHFQDEKINYLFIKYQNGQDTITRKVD